MTPRNCAKVCGAIFLLFLLVVPSYPDTRVAIVGAGIGGATCSYYLSKEFTAAGQKFEIDLIEKSDRVGGRVKSFSITDFKPSISENGEHIHISGSEKSSKPEEVTLYFELGAAVWAAPNIHLDELVNELQIPVELPSENADEEDIDLVVYEGKGKSFKLDMLENPLSKNTLLTAAQMEKFKLYLLQNYLEFLPRDFGLRKEIVEKEHYKKLAGVPNRFTKPWTSIEEWTNHGDISTFTQTTTANYLNSYGVSKEWIRRNVEPLTRVIYDQGATANAFAGLVAMVSGDQVRSAVNGNQDMIATIIESSKSNLRLSTAVSLLRKSSESQEYELFNSDNQSLGKFDIVILAAPLEYLNIEFSGLGSNPTILKRQYVGKSSTWIKAKGLNTKFFGLPNTTNALLTNQLSDQNDVPFFSILPHHRYYNRDILYKVFSRRPMDKDGRDLANWFIDGTILEAHNWEYTFPMLDPLGNSTNRPYQPVILDSNLYYVSAIDSVAVAMEASTMTCNNLANLIVNHPTLNPYHPSHQKSSTHEYQQYSTVNFTLIPYFEMVLDHLPKTTFGELFLFSYALLGCVYVLSGLSWIGARFKFIPLVAIILIGHTCGYWYEVAVSYLKLSNIDATEFHGHAILIAADIFGGISVAIACILGDAILPLALLSRSIIQMDKSVFSGAALGLSLWPFLSDRLQSVLALLSRFLGGSKASLSILDVVESASYNVSISLILGGLFAAVLGTSKSLHWKTVLMTAPILAISHIGYICAGNLLGTKSLWTRLVPSHVASFQNQDGLAAIIDPLSSTQTTVLGVVPCFFFGAVFAKMLWGNEQEYSPRFPGPLRFFAGFIMIIGMGIHAGSYFFLASYLVTMCLGSLI